jgi:hypothetical protein
MRTIIEPPPESGAPLGPLWKRLAWFAGLSIGTGFATALVAFGLRVLLK